MPSKAVDGYRFRGFGTARLHMNGQPLEGEDENFVDCNYSIQWDLGHVCFNEGWTDFKAAAHIGDEALLDVKIEPMQGHIGLNFVEIIN